ncbi:MAG: oligosaccharide flippase family protein [Candidatus Kerfeldbacteria bacterium]|nr:oligosaccharide flippase family protein [Candidatus Kerfeldbacteria bacterium]
MARSAEELAHGQARILSNTSYLLAATVIQKLVSLGYFVYFVRTIGPKDFGHFEPIRTAIPIALILIDFSFSVVLTREVAKAPERVISYVNNVMSVKILLAIVALLAGLAINAFFPFSQVTRTLLFLAGCVVAFDMFTMTLTAGLRGVQIFRYEAFGIVATQLTTAVLGIIGLTLGFGLYGLMVAILGGSIVNFSYMLTMFRRKLGAFPKLSWDGAVIRRFMIIALPILGAALLAKLFTYADLYFLLGSAGQTAVGIYRAAHKIPFALEFVPAAFAASLLPAMSYYFVHAREHLTQVFERALRYLIIFSIPIVVGVFILAEPFITKLFNRVYLGAVEPLRIMILALPFIFLNFPVGSFLIATNRQIWNTVNLGVAVTINIGLNLVLQPKLGANGAAIAILVSYVLLLSLGLIQVWRVAPFKLRTLLTIFVQTVAAAAIMGLPLIFLQEIFSPYFLIIPAVGLYIATLFLFGTLRLTDLALALRVVTRRGT